MDRNTFWGLFLILVILVGSTFLMKPSEEEIKREKLVQDSIARLNSQPAKKTAGTAAIKSVQKGPDTTLVKGPFGKAFQGTEQEIALENELIR
ncbi:MAG: hypothetical protein RLZ47_350, partial [Bacteroidota bacterium]